jgi:hypothetical protein
VSSRKSHATTRKSGGSSVRQAGGPVEPSPSSRRQRREVSSPLFSTILRLRHLVSLDLRPRSRFQALPVCNLRLLSLLQEFVSHTLLESLHFRRIPTLVRKAPFRRFPLFSPSGEKRTSCGTRSTPSSSLVGPRWYRFHGSVKKCGLSFSLLLRPLSSSFLRLPSLRRKALAWVLCSSHMRKFLWLFAKGGRWRRFEK